MVFVRFLNEYTEHQSLQHTIRPECACANVNVHANTLAYKVGSKLRLLPQDQRDRLRSLSVNYHAKSHVNSCEQSYPLTLNTGFLY